MTSQPAMSWSLLTQENPSTAGYQASRESKHESAEILFCMCRVHSRASWYSA